MADQPPAWLAQWLAAQAKTQSEANAAQADQTAKLIAALALKSNEQEDRLLQIKKK